MKTIYIAHPLGAALDRPQNILRASRWVAWASRLPEIRAVATWSILASVWQETPENREKGLHLDAIEVASADELWLVGGRLSEGMLMNALHAKKVFNLIGLGTEPPIEIPRIVQRILRGTEPQAIQLIADGKLLGFAMPSQV
jgi:hypothetical protein